MNHTILPHHVRRMFIFQLCCHFIVTTLEKKDSIYIKTKESLNDFLVGQTSYCIRGLVVIRARFFTPNNVRRIIIIVHVCITYTWIDIHDWLSIIIISFAFKDTKLVLVATFKYVFNTCLHIRSTIFQPTH